MFNLKKIFSKKTSGDVISTVENITNPVENLTVTQKTNFSDRLSVFSILVLSAVCLISPLIFVPAIANWFDLPKQTFLVVAVLILALAFSLKTLLAKKLTLTRSVFDVPILIFALSSLVSAFLSTNRFAGFTSDTLVYVGGALLFFAITQTVKKEGTLLTLIKSLLVSGAVLSVWTVIQIIESPTNPSGFLSLNFNPAGSNLSQAMFLVALLPLAVGLYLKSKKKLVLGLLVLNVIGLVGTFYGLYKFNPAILPFEAGWKIATGTLGQALNTVFFGVGPSNFVDAFTAYRPMSLNLTPLWNLRFSSGGPFYFYILTTIGLVGLSAVIFLVYRILKLAKKRFELETVPVLEKGLFASLGLILLMYTVLPSPTVLTITLFCLLGFLTVYFGMAENTSVVHQKEISLPENFVVNSLIPLAILAFSVMAVFQLGKIVLADYYYAQSLYAANANRGTDTYNFQIQAITLNPYNDSYRVAYSQTNLALADSLASQNPAAAGLTEEQKNMVTQLVQQSLREARNAASLQPQRAANWENLAAIYRSLINFAQGADQWTLASFGQAISLDPNNPRLRFDLGGIYFANKDWQSAAQAFSLATTLKPDYANAHYNLAQSLKSLNLYDQAVKELELTASLVCVSENADCDKVKKEIEDINTPIGSDSAELATPSAAVKNLPNAKTTPPVKISSPSGEIKP